MHDENAATLLTDELRRDDELDESERAALWRVRRRLDLQVAPVARPFAARRSRWALGARAGLAAALLFGTALGAGGHALAVALWAAEPTPNLPSAPLVTPRTGLPTPISTPKPLLAPAPATAPAPEPEPALDVTAAPTLQAAPHNSSKASSHDAEQELLELEAARRALRSGEAEQATRLLDAHAQRYATSALAQERDALRVKALVRSGRHAAARAAADAFAARYPTSLLLDSVKRTVATIP